MPNIENMRKTLELMAADPTLVDQASWAYFQNSCATTACMAGWASSLVGQLVRNGCGDPVVQVDGVSRNIGQVAEGVLGFDAYHAEAFFLRTSGLEGRQAIAVLYQMAEIVTDGEVRLPVEFEADYEAANKRYAGDQPDIARFYLRDVL